MPLPALQLLAVPGLPEIAPGDDLGALILDALRAAELRATHGDIFVVAQKVVSKAEGQLVRLDSVEPSLLARQWAASHQKDARVVEVVLQQSRRLVRMDRGLIIAETHHGFVCANAGVDASNVPAGAVTVLPRDPDASARRLQEQLEQAAGVRLAVLISDTFGRPWREGVLNVAIGVAGLAPLVDYRGRPDDFGRTLQVTVVAVADELAAAAELLMRKTSRLPVVLIRGFAYEKTGGSAQDLVRPDDRDLFR